MKATSSLSKIQILTLESCYIFLRTHRSLLQTLGNEVDPAHRELIVEQMELALLNESRLLENFREVAAAAERWNAAKAKGLIADEVQ
jgi:hypothetical protein